MSRSSSRKRRGSEAVEFALVMPVFLALVMGGIEFSWFLGQNAVFYLSMRAGARAGAVSMDTEAVDAAEAGAQAEWDRFGFPSTVTFEAELEGDEPELMIQLEGDMAYASLTGLYLTGRTVHREVEMYMEDQYTQDW